MQVCIQEKIGYCNRKYDPDVHLAWQHLSKMQFSQWCNDFETKYFVGFCCYFRSYLWPFSASPFSSVGRVTWWINQKYISRTLVHSMYKLMDEIPYNKRPEMNYFHWISISFWVYPNEESNVYKEIHSETGCHLGEFCGLISKLIAISWVVSVSLLKSSLRLKTKFKLP